MAKIIIIYLCSNLDNKIFSIQLNVQEDFIKISNDSGFVLKKAKSQHRYIQTWYGVLESYIIRFADFVLRLKKEEKRITKKIL